jgi:hypothetical protein
MGGEEINRDGQDVQDKKRGKGEMVKRGRGKEKGMPCVILLPFYPFTLYPLTPLFILTIPV